jgi:putative ABC transport system permease protein
MLIPFDVRYQPQQRVEFVNNLLGRIGALPGVQAVGAINSLPLSGSESLSNFSVDGYANNPEQIVEARSVTPQYFSAMNIPLVAGRLFNDADTVGAQKTVIVNQAFANTYFANRNPIGGRIGQDEHHSQWKTIVGVVADVRHTSLEEAPPPQMYEPGFQNVFQGSLGSANIVVRSIRPPSAVAAEIRSTLHAIDPNLAITDIRTMGDLVSAASARRRFQTSLLTVFAAIALILALVGLYGLMAYSVGRRTREVGIRMALGAQRSNVLMLVMKKAALLLALGLAAGLAGTWFATRAIATFLYGVNQHDPVTIVSVCALLAVCGLVAALIPARRAASIDPMQALRTE